MRAQRFLDLAAATTPAMILQVSWANGLDILRDLAPAGVPLLAVDTNPRAIGLHSRLAAPLVCPDPRHDERAFLAFLERIGRRLPQRCVLFPTHDQYIWPISRHADWLGQWYIIPFSRWETMRRLYDKREQLETAQRIGVDIPKTVFVDSDDDLERGAEEIGFPAIFKPVESLAFKERFRRHVLEIGSHEELLRVYDTVRDCGTLMLQDIIPGGDEELYTLGSYLDAHSRPLAQFTGHKLRQHPPRFGHVSMAVSVWVPQLADAGLRLLQALNYHGVSQVEFKRDPRDGRYRLMEINARHWMWHSLAGACGVNLSLAAYRDAIGAPFVAPRQIDGPRWVVSLTDARDALSRFRHGDGDVLPWLLSYRGVKVDGLYSLRDPLPGALLTARQLRRFATRTGRPHQGAAP
jgi:predicted ATP-grasp superfamily ATP-dependent carboligase